MEFSLLFALVMLVVAVAMILGARGRHRGRGDAGRADGIGSARDGGNGGGSHGADGGNGGD